MVKFEGSSCSWVKKPILFWDTYTSGIADDYLYNDERQESVLCGRRGLWPVADLVICSRRLNSDKLGNIVLSKSLINPLLQPIIIVYDSSNICGKPLNLASSTPAIHYRFSNYSITC